MAVFRFLGGCCLVFAVHAAWAGPPACPREPLRFQASPANAGCLVRSGRHLLVVRDRLSGKLGLPGGRSIPPEPAHCTAERETWEETGYAVTAERLLTGPSSDFRLYHCRIVGAYQIREKVARPLRAALEIEAIHWVIPTAVDREDLRFPAHWPYLLELFERLPIAEGS